ncbi:MAG TPA: DUF1214 domain-containing protein [Candidatus Dormibacteraeota bacterium]|nr:DUF1214 domain-containing protein [Candidatus Dormibacteraeota bacterium]
MFDGPAINRDDPWNFLAVIDRALTETPPRPSDTAALTSLAALGLGSGMPFDPSRLDEQARRAILAGMADARQQIAAKSLSGKIVNGWAYPLRGIGRYGEDYLLRAATALKSLAALEPVEATYLTYVGGNLEGSRRYRLRFAAGELPPVGAFWSLSAYEVTPDRRMYFADNPIHRYSIGDRTPALAKNPDGGLDLHIQHDSPGANLESNWLPVPAGHFALVLRAYLPRLELLDESYRPPSLEHQP